ncbi:hypothetical protein OGAPHI_006748 [Ogataea philodendri]|uniref:Uncharacterized protein n=1 Tax=Ogataea philodendri TaxID=1378263 RepID=A0A9P8T165_9ASCO|nr:uncharacterized protein OGAPHI_006748 [Ogataea philodendri]KAH3661341.1 hypothetical protein OGAPHI_006748 [Ogataea philodendri]
MVLVFNVYLWINSIQAVDRTSCPHFETSSAGGLSFISVFLIGNFSAGAVQDFGETVDSESHSLVQVTFHDFNMVVEVGPEQLDVGDGVPFDVFGAQVSWEQNKRDVGLVVSVFGFQVLDFQWNFLV